MKRFKELVFLLKLPRIKKATIYKKYFNQLMDGLSIEELEELIKTEYEEISTEQINFAKIQSEKLYNELTESENVTAITIFDDNYPEQLKQLNKSPLILFVKGNTECLNGETVAIVGTRKPSEWSKKIEVNLVNKILETSNVVIVSGLALGCDCIAHKTTVDAKRKTIAVLPSGLNQITPKSNKDLAQEIIETGGCLITEYFPDEKIDLYNNNYVERDGVIAGLSYKTIVIEASEKSGTMHTVDSAIKIGRPVACYYTNDLSKGKYDGNLLIANEKNGFKLSNLDDLKSFLNIKTNTSGKKDEQISLF